MQRSGRLLYLGHALALSVGVLVLNLRLYQPGSAAYARPKLGEDVVSQLHFIGASLKAGSGDEMQGIFPEGFFFSHVLYGLSWVEVGLRSDPQSAQYAEALQEGQWALERLNSSDGLAPFDKELSPAYGVFYVGWKSWLEGGLLLMQPPAGRDAQAVTDFEAETDSLAQAFSASPTPFLQAYYGQAWPVDNTVAVAALRLHDKLFAPKYAGVIARWLTQTQTRLDPRTSLLPHSVDSETGQLQEGARATSQSLITRFALEIDPDWGHKQYAAYRQQFIAPFLGVPGAHEYPEGASGFGDVDSGPLVFGFSPSATVVSLAAAQVSGDAEVADALIPASEAVGLPLSWGDSKRYLFGLMPVGDAFLVWAKTSSLWTGEIQPTNLPSIVNPYWRWPFHGVALGLVALLWLPILWRLKRT